MASPPEGSETVEGCTTYGIDAKGHFVFFGFKLKDRPSVSLIADHHRLGLIINYLQTIALEAEQRRLLIDPDAATAQPRGGPRDPIWQVQFEPDVEGKSARLICTTRTGIPIELEMPFDLIELLPARLLDLSVELRNRQAARRKRHLLST